MLDGEGELEEETDGSDDSDHDDETDLLLGGAVTGGSGMWPLPSGCISYRIVRRTRRRLLTIPLFAAYIYTAEATLLKRNVSTDSLSAGGNGSATKRARLGSIGGGSGIGGLGGEEGPGSTLAGSRGTAVQKDVLSQVNTDSHFVITMHRIPNVLPRCR